MRTILSLTVTPLSCLLLLSLAENAWALQSHGGPEGIYVHQMAHVLFMASLGYLQWHTRRTQDEGIGWKYLRFACLMLFCWNALAFTGHQAFEHLTTADFLDKNTWSEQLVMPITPAKVLYYITKMDHFLMVPALLALVMSLRTFYLEAVNGGQK